MLWEMLASEANQLPISEQNPHWDYFGWTSARLILSTLVFKGLFVSLMFMKAEAMSQL